MSLVADLLTWLQGGMQRLGEAVSLRVREEPVLTVGLFRAAITMLVGFGLGWSGEQVALMVAFVEARHRLGRSTAVTPTTSPSLPEGQAVRLPDGTAADGRQGLTVVDGSLTGLRLSGLRGTRRRLRLAHDERAPLRPLRPPGLRQPLPAHARPSGPADVAPGDGWRSGRSRPMSPSTAGAARAGIASRTRSDPASSRPTIRCRSSSVASRYRRGPACSARAATRGRA